MDIKEANCSVAGWSKEDISDSVNNVSFHFEETC